MADEETTHRTGAEPGNPPWKAKTLWLAAGLALLGLVMWITVPPTPTPAAGESGGNSLAQSAEGASAPTVTSLRGSPSLFRFGVSYIAGFFLGYGLRRFMKVTLVISALLFGALFALRKLGWIDLDWAGVEAHLSHSFAWLQGQASALKEFVTGYVPSAIAAAVGLFFGARWR